MDQNWHQQRYNQFRNEMTDASLHGPYIMQRGEAKQLEGGFTYTGYCFELFSSDLSMSAPMLADESYFSRPLENLYLLPQHVTFSFYKYPYGVPLCEGEPMLRLTCVLKELYGHATNATDPLEVMASLEQLIPQHRQAPLHSRARNFVSEHLRDLGFAVAKVDPQSGNIRVRLAWLFPGCRNGSRDQYLSAGTIRLIQKKGDIFDGAEFLPRSQNGVSSILEDRIRSVTNGSISRIISDEGKDRIMDKFLWSKGVKSPRSIARQNKIDFISRNPELWSNPRQLAKNMQQKGLYSRNTGLQDIEYSCKRLIDKVRLKMNEG